MCHIYESALRRAMRFSSKQKSKHTLTRIRLKMTAGSMGEINAGTYDLFVMEAQETLRENVRVTPTFRSDPVRAVSLWVRRDACRKAQSKKGAHGGHGGR